MYLAFLGNLGTWEIIIILVIALLLFGRRLPEVGRSLGKGIVEFKKGLKGVQDDIENEVDEADRNIDRIESSKKGTVDMNRKKEESPTGKSD
jgi:sec-independent protein translocase protein TatA